MTTSIHQEMQTKILLGVKAETPESIFTEAVTKEEMIAISVGHCYYCNHFSIEKFQTLFY